MLFDWTVSIGNLLALGGFLISGIGFVYTMRGRLDGLSERLLELEREFQKLLDVLIAQGRQEERLIAIDQRVLTQGQRIDDLIRRVNQHLDDRE